MAETSGLRRSPGGYGSLGNRRLSRDRSRSSFRAIPAAPAALLRMNRRTENPTSKNATAGASRPILKRPDPSPPIQLHRLSDTSPLFFGREDSPESLLEGN